jgi:predicted aspartyl protease
VPQTFVSAVLVAIAVLSPEFLAAAASAAPEPEIAVRIDESGAVIVPVTINGRGPFPFLLDTGSTHSVISRSLADRLALRFVAKTSVLTSTGREWRPVVELDETAIGGTRAGGILASVAPSKQLDDVARGLEGIVGQDFLFGFNYTLDYRRHRLTWDDGGSREDGVRLPLVAHGGRYLVQVMSTRNEAPLLLVPDSGASGFVAYERHGRTKLALAPAFAPSAADRFGAASAAAGTTAVHSLSGGHVVRTMMLRELRLGTITLREHPVAVVSRDTTDAEEGDGLLPLHLFASVSFNAREQSLVIRRQAE